MLGTMFLANSGILPNLVTLTVVHLSTTTDQFEPFLPYVGMYIHNASTKTKSMAKVGSSEISTLHKFHDCLHKILVMKILIPTAVVASNVYIQ
jgi:hypothetical protein